MVNMRCSQQKTRIYLPKWTEVVILEKSFLKFHFVVHFSNSHCAVTLTELLDLAEDKPLGTCLMS